MTTQTVLINDDFYQVEYKVTAKMAAIAAMPFSSTYGKTKVPTPEVVNYAGRTRRIYCDAVGNAGRSYIIVTGEKVFVR